MTDWGDGAPRKEIDRMLADAVLPEEIRPRAAAVSDPPAVALVTGSCGFLGRQVVLQLLRHTDLHLVCLVRDKAGERAPDRAARVFSALGIGSGMLDARVEVLSGDSTAPNLALDPGRYSELADRVDSIYHCAARVDWVRSYRHLYRVNVGGVLEMIRFACAGRTKRLLFVSSIAVCYATGGPERIDEQTDMLAHIGGMPLGYARSKCIAEALLKQAAARGLPVTVLRPTLIAGDSRTGESNPTDLIAALLQGCVRSGMAIDTDWLLDCLPVDYVAEVVATVPQGGSTWRVLHLMHQRPRHWRELILWTNLHGYPIDLVPRDVWIGHLFDRQAARGSLLYAQRRFFRGSPPREGESEWVRPFESYLAPSQARIDSRRTRALLDDLGLREAPLDAGLLHAYFDYYRGAGVLPERSLAGHSALALDTLLGEPWTGSDGRHFAPNWAAAERTPIGGDDGLLKEIAAARSWNGAGVWRLDLQEGHQRVSAVLKVKASGRMVQDLSAIMARVCRPALGELFHRFDDAFGLARAPERELGLYESRHPGLTKHRPACYATFRDAGRRCSAMLLEYLPAADTRKQRRSLRANQPGMRAVLHGLAEIHAVGFGRAQGLASQVWLTPPPDTARMVEMAPLWSELADFAATWFEGWCGFGIRSLQADFIGDLSDWWPRLRELPVTLIHNDFNPRNFVLREIGSELRLCVYDWELATLGVPQHDLAELLCFTWSDAMTGGELDTLLGSYRATLSSVSGVQIDAEEWRRGFELALRHLLINRLALYTMMHRFRPLGYLPRVMRNWMRLYSWARQWQGRTRCAEALG